MNETNVIRLALILEDQAATTVDKYICNLVEYIIFSGENKNMSSVELCKQINEQFSLEFDILEVEKAINRKARGRIVCEDKKYQLTAKVIDQLSKQKDPINLLSQYIELFLRDTGKNYDKDLLLDAFQEYLYYCFNSSTDNLLNLLKAKQHNLSDKPTSDKLKISNDMMQQINEFISWNNGDKDKLIYDIISFSYEYCMLTTKKDSLLSNKLFRGKRFFLDTNIIFRMAGINKDERQFVTESFIKKCKEVGISLYYTSETLNEIYRVIDGQIKYIKYLTQGQRPIDSAILQSIDYTNGINDFYELYYNWCKEPNNRYDDYLSFQQYLIGLVRQVIEKLDFKNIDNKNVGTKHQEFVSLCDNLNDYKIDRRPRKPNSKESLQADINNILYILSLRSESKTNDLWQTNDYFVSADQLLTNWAKNTYSGVPIVVIPSTWLSIMLKFGGRTETDYKAFCLFLTLRQHKEEHGEVFINPATLLSKLSKRTTDVEIKQRIIEEIITNPNEYTFDSQDDYSKSIDDAFERILQESNDTIECKFNTQIEDIEKEYKETVDELNEQLKTRSTEDEHIMRMANNKAEMKVERWKRLGWLKAVFPALSLLLIIAMVIVFFRKVEPFFGIIAKILPAKTIEGSSTWSFFTWVTSIIIAIVPSVFIAPLNYLSSDDRKHILVKKYARQEKKYLYK